MFHSIEGTILNKTNELIILKLLNLGFEIEIFSLSSDNLEVDKNIKLYVYDTLTQDNNFVFYGFKDYDDYRLFKLLIKINGIGCKGALNILNECSAKNIVDFINENKINELSKFTHIGIKKAQAIYYSLKNKVQDFESSSSNYLEAYEFLTKLGYSELIVKKGLAKIDLTKDLQSIVKEFIKNKNNE